MHFPANIIRFLLVQAWPSCLGGAMHSIAVFLPPMDFRTKTRHYFCTAKLYTAPYLMIVYSRCKVLGADTQHKHPRVKGPSSHGCSIGRRWFAGAAAGTSIVHVQDTTVRAWTPRIWPRPALKRTDSPGGRHREHDPINGQPLAPSPALGFVFRVSFAQVKARPT